MKNAPRWLPLSLAGSILILYTIAALRGLLLLCCLLSALLCLAAAVALLRCVFTPNEKTAVRITFLFLCLASLVRAAADAHIGLYRIPLGAELSTDYPYRCLYTTVSLLMAVAVVIFVIYRFHYYRGVQLLLDSAVFGLSGIVTVWQIGFADNMALIKTTFYHNYTALVGIILDCIILSGALIWYLSVRRGKILPSIVMCTSGIVLVILTDIHNYAFYLRYDSVPSFVLRGLYLLSFVLLAVGALRHRWFFEEESAASQKSIVPAANRNRKPHTFVLFAFPLITVIAKGFTWPLCFTFFGIITFYHVSTYFIQMALRNERLLTQEKHMNSALESQVRTHYRALQEKNATLRTLSDHDPATGLFNRPYFMKALQTMAHDADPSESVILFFMDLDRFKFINDIYGHVTGDAVLKAVADRLKKWENREALISRLGGDEFSIVLKGIFSEPQIRHLAKEIIGVCNEKFSVGDYELAVSFCVGASVCPADSIDVEMLLRHADIAMYEAKKKGFNQCAFFTRELEYKAKRRALIEMLLRQVDYDQEFELVYQPQFHIPDQTLIGMEALLRWHSPTVGDISPAEFIPIAEGSDCIVPIGDWVMKQAIRTIARWNRAYGTNLRMSINVSPKQLAGKTFFEHLEQTMLEQGANPAWLDMEITETLAVQSQNIQEVSYRFRRLGVSVSIDDFGSGYSSLATLKSICFDRIKINKSLIDTIADEDFDRQITKLILLLADTMEMTVIAEGIETPEQLDILCDMGCPQIQGYLLSKPLTYSDLESRYLEPHKVSAS